MGSGYAFQDQGWKQRNFLLCDLQEVVRQSDQSMIDALQRIRFGDYTAIEYFSKNARKKPFSSEEGVVYLCVKNRGYSLFRNRVAEGRKMSTEQVEKIAQGRSHKSGSIAASGAFCCQYEIAEFRKSSISNFI